MSPVEYAAEIVDSNYRKSPILGAVLTDENAKDLGQFLCKGYEAIGKRVSERYARMSPEATNLFVMLESFLLVFVEHATNWELLEDAMERTAKSGCDCKGACG
jgi:hypothetical protein